ncbi:hypothetical protein [Variovorax sp. LT1R16]|uniref:hypothetical protein n=1 Tax=Variovorax sp. LT1R16 TaxID=3443728 RepID=UPI003F47F8AD
MKTFAVWCPDFGSERSDARHFKAIDHEDAACKWAQREDQASAEYSIVGGTSMVVMVSEGDDAPQEFTVSGEAVPAYQARAAKKEVDD